MNSKTIASVIDLTHRIDIAQAYVETGRAHLAAAIDRHADAIEHGARERHIRQIATQIEGAESRLREQLDTLQALERERDADAAIEHADEIHTDLVTLLEDAITLHGADAPEVITTVTERLGERVRMMAESFDAQRRVDMRTTHLSHALAVARAALFVALERPDVIARLSMGLTPATAWERQTTPSVVEVPECMQGVKAYGPAQESECVGGLEYASDAEELPCATVPPEADWSRDGAEVINVDAEVFGALRALEHDMHDPARWDELGDVLDGCEHPDVRAVCLERMARARRAVGEVGPADPLFDAMLRCSHAELAEDPEDWADMPTPAEQIRTSTGAEMVVWPDATVTVVGEFDAVQSWPNEASAVGQTVRFERLRAQDAADATLSALRGGER